MSKLGYILSIFCLVAYSYAEDGCMDGNACNWDPEATVDDGSCEGAPGIINDIDADVNDGENSVLISWSRPCGLGNIFAYTLVGNIDGEDVELSISSPYFIENLSWSTTYNLEISTSGDYGDPSVTPFQFSIDPENIPTQILGLAAEADEASIALSWYSEDYSSTYIIYLDGDPVYTTPDNVSSAVISGLNANIYFEFQVSGLNSQGAEGEKSDPVEKSPLSIPPVTDIQSSPGSGQVTFSWSSPDPYADDNDYTFILFDESDEIIEGNYDGNYYIISDLQTNEQRCIKITAVHQFGESDVSNQFCESSNIPPPTEVEGLSLTSGEGFVSLEWDNHPDAIYYNIYRDDSLITSPPLWLPGDGSYDDINLQANTQYEYVVVALNNNGAEGAEHDPVFIIVTPLPVVENVEVGRCSGRITFEWPSPANYAGAGYSYEIYHANNLVNSTELNQAFVEGLEQTDPCCNGNPILSNCADCNEYCFVFKSVSLGGYGNSEDSEEFCAIPYTTYGDDESYNLEWGIQIIAELEPFSENISNEIDQYNLIGVSESATDAYDSNVDIFDSPNPNTQFSLFFPHIEWGNSPNDNFSQDIRSNMGLPDTVIVWDALLTTEIPGEPYLTFYFNDITDSTTVYVSYYDSSNNQERKFQKIEDGDTIDLETIFSGEGNGSDLEIIVGQAIPAAPTNLEGLGGYREITITWEDSCCQPGLQQYPAQSYNIWRGGVLVGRNIIGNTFTDRGWNCFIGANNTYDQHVNGDNDVYDCTLALDPLTDYTYEVSAINIAGESDRSLQVFQLSTLENRFPVSKAGMDIVVYDLQENNEEGTLITLPVYSDFSNENQSYDPDNSYEQDGSIYLYSEPLDDLEFKWTSVSSSEYTDSELTITIEGYGEKGFELEVNDGRDLFSIDSVFVTYLAAPAPAIVDSIDISAGLYDIELHFLESMFTGESYADLNNNLIWDEKESFQDCGFDNLCPGNSDYYQPDIGQSNGQWDFEDLNGNGVIDWFDSNANGI